MTPINRIRVISFKDIIQESKTRKHVVRKKQVTRQGTLTIVVGYADETKRANDEI